MNRGLTENLGHIRKCHVREAFCKRHNSKSIQTASLVLCEVICMHSAEY